MLRKIGLAAIMLGSFLASSVFAKTPKNTPYVGVDFEYNYLNFTSAYKETYKKLPKFLNSNRTGVGVFAGYRWDCLGTELGFNFIQRIKYDVDEMPVEVWQKNNNWYLDGIYYYAIDNNLDLKASLGIGYLHSKTTLDALGQSFNLPYNGGKIGARAGVGAQYYFTDHVSSSLKYTFQTGNKMVKNLQQVALGVAYHF